MTRRAQVVFGVLVAVVIAQALFLVREHRKAARRDQELAKLNEERALFCVFYRGTIQSNRLAMETARNVGDRAFGHLFYHLSLSSYLDLCHVDDSTKAKMAKRDWGCERVVGGYDYPCLARVARELEDAIPSTSAVSASTKQDH